MRPALYWALACVLAALGLWQTVTAWLEGVSSGHDFVQDYAAVRAIAEGRNPYEPYNRITQELFGGPPHRGNLYSFHAPSSLPFFLPLLPLLPFGYGFAFVTWGVASLAALAGVCVLTGRQIGIRRWAAVGALLALALAALPPIRENFIEGQLNVIVTLGMVGAWALHRASRDVAAGIALGAAFALKPIPGLFFVYFAVRGRFRLLAAALATLAACSLLGLALAGVDGAWMWATVNYPDHAAIWPGYPDNGSLRGFFTRLFGPIPRGAWLRPPYPTEGLSTVLWVLASGCCALVAWLATRQPRGRPADVDAEIVALFPLTLLVTPIIWPHYYVVLIPPLMITVSRLMDARRENRRRLMLPAVLLAAALAVLAPAHYVEPYRGDGGWQLIALLLVFGVTLWVCRPERESAQGA
ncbi:MAG: glycosyltransferase family 87 protein [Chloroflexota bacterium]